MRGHIPHNMKKGTVCEQIIVYKYKSMYRIIKIQQKQK